MGTRQEELDRIEREKLVLTNQDKLKDEIKDLRREVLILRRAKEAFDYGEVIEESDDVDLDDVPSKEVEDD